MFYSLKSNKRRKKTVESTCQQLTTHMQKIDPTCDTTLLSFTDMLRQLPLPSSVCKTQECHAFLKINFITAFIQIYNSIDLPFSFFLVLVSIEKIQLFRQRLSLLSVKANTKRKSPCGERPLTSNKEPLVTITHNNMILSTLSCKLLHFCKRTFLERAVYRNTQNSV